MGFDVVIPARYASTRLPGKPLADINGKTLIEHVYHAARRSDAERVIIATDDTRVAEAVQSCGAEVCMTRQDHLSGTDRLAEVVQTLDIDSQRIVVNLQGDEPFAPADLLNSVANALQVSQDAVMATACHKIDQAHVINDPNVVKVVCDQNHHALYFSRSPIPYRRDPENVDVDYYQHIGIYAYRTEFIKRYSQLPPSPIELAESLEQLRVLDNGYSIAVTEFSHDVGFGIDTPEDLQRARERMALQDGE